MEDCNGSLGMQPVIPSLGNSQEYLVVFKSNITLASPVLNTCNVQGRNELIISLYQWYICYPLFIPASPLYHLFWVAPLSPTTHVLLSWFSPSNDPLCWVLCGECDLRVQHNSCHHQLHLPAAGTAWVRRVWILCGWIWCSQKDWEIQQLYCIFREPQE